MAVIGDWVSVGGMFVIPSFHIHHQRQGREQATEVLRDISKELDGHIKSLIKLDSKLGKRQHVPGGYHIKWCSCFFIFVSPCTCSLAVLCYFSFSISFRIMYMKDALRRCVRFAIGQGLSRICVSRAASLRWMQISFIEAQQMHGVTLGSALTTKVAMQKVGRSSPSTTHSHTFDIVFAKLIFIVIGIEICI